jgi:transaldolase
MIELIDKYQPGIPLSVEVFSRDPEQMLVQAESFMDTFQYPQMSIKVQVGWNELETISRLSKKGISVNCTACMDAMQAIMAARAGAKYVSLFWGRIRDGGLDPATAAQRDQLKKGKVLDDKDFDPAFVTSYVRQLIDQGKIDSEIIVGSIRSVVDIRDAALSGAHIVTIPPKFYPAMMGHFKTDQVVTQFLNDFQGWMT